MKSKLTKKQKNIIRTWRKNSVMLFAIVLYGFALIGLLIPLRPSTSQKEKRKLTAFPTPTLTTFVNGQFFSDLSLWYSDTYPMRDTLVSADQSLKNLYGLEASVQMVGGDTKADEIPVATKQETTEFPIATFTDSTDTTTEVTHKKEPVLPDSKAMEAEIQNQIQDGVYIKDGAAYSVYYFTQSSADTYIEALEHAAATVSQNGGKLYSILVPNQSGVLLSQDTLDKLGGSNQEQAIDYYYNSYNQVVPVDAFHPLREHNEEYIYFRTDHHWTQLGAYYAYQSFCKAKGISPHDLSTFAKTQRFEPFYGSFYASYANSQMTDNPDYVDAYYPNDTNDLTFWDTDGTKYDWQVITDVTGWSSDSMYACFIGGDKPLSIVHNPKINDGSSCLVLKESYGNCFVPFLIDHYQDIHVIDFRYAQENVMDYMRENHIKDLIVINNITIIGSTDVANTISQLLQ